MSALKILVYEDQGAGERSIAAARKSLGSMFPRAIIRGVYAADLRTPGWGRGCDLLVFPGGRDLPYCNALRGEGIAHIRSYVSNGGRYLGFCAGAYFATRYCEFDRGGELEVCGERALSLIPVRAVGPAFGVGTYQYGSEVGARVVSLRGISSETFVSYFHGGCYFSDLPDDGHITVLARYEEIQGEPPAVIASAFAGGRVVLCGVHPEYDGCLLRESVPELASSLERGESERIALLAAIRGGLGL